MWLAVGGMPGLGSMIADLLQPQPARDVRPALVKRDDARAAQRRGGGLPLLFLGGQARLELRQLGLIRGRARRVERGQPRRDQPRDRARVLGRDPVVRVAQRVDVAHRAQLIGRDGGDVFGANRRRRVDVARLAALDAPVARLLHQRRQPADLQVEADVHQRVGAVQRQHQRRLRLDEVRVLVAARQRRDIDPVAAHLAGEVGERFDRRDDAQLGLGAGAQHGDRGETTATATTTSLNGCRMFVLLVGVRAVRAHREFDLHEPDGHR